MQVRLFRIVDIVAPLAIQEELIFQDPLPPAEASRRQRQRFAQQRRSLHDLRL